MPARPQLPIALTIAGSDSGGAAGLQADLQTFARLRVHGTTVVTCLTAQNPRVVMAIQPTRPSLVRQQLDAVFAELRPAASKTGMLYSAGLIEVIADFMRSQGKAPLIVDPVMVATSGAVLLKPAAIRALTSQLFPLATLVTPNLDEARILTRRSITSPEDLRGAARQIHEHSGCAVLAKGGHLRDGREAIDIFYDGQTELLLTAPFLRGVSTHGTGCTYSAAITAWCARGLPLIKAVMRAKQFITDAIARSVRVRHYDVLHWQAAGDVKG